MDKYLLFRRGLAVGIILLFVGITLVPNINFMVVKAFNDNNLVEVTTQACGIEGFGNTTVKLTREQYLNLEQYLVDFRTRLNQTTTRGEAIPIFNDAVLELNKYRLLPKGMSVEQAQNLVTGKYQSLFQTQILEEILKRTNEKFVQIMNENITNLCCLVYARSNNQTIYIAQCPLILSFFLVILASLPGFVIACMFIQAISYVISRVSSIALFSYLIIVGKDTGPGEVSVISIGFLGFVQNSLRDQAMSIFGFSGLKFQFGGNDYAFEHGFVLGCVPAIFNKIIW